MSLLFYIALLLSSFAVVIFIQYCVEVCFCYSIFKLVCSFYAVVILSIKCCRLFDALLSCDFFITLTDFMLLAYRRIIAQKFYCCYICYLQC